MAEDHILGFGIQFPWKNATGYGHLCLSSLAAQVTGLSPISRVSMLATLLLAFCVWWNLRKFDYDAREPPMVRPRIPLVGHLVGLLWSQVNYFSQVHAQSQLPIATLPIGAVRNGRIYVIFSAPLQQAALRNSRDMDAASFMVDFVPRVFGVRQGTVDRLLGRDGVHPSVMNDMERVFQAALSGDSLARMTVTALGHAADVLNAIPGGGGALEVPNLFDFLQMLVTKGTSMALWGRDNNPFEDDEVVRAQWDFEAHMGPLVLGILPSIIARKAYLARATVQAALARFFRARHDQCDPSVGELVRARARLLRAYGIDDDELARNEVAVTLVATTNALSTLFWCVAYIFVRPELLAEVRREVAAAVLRPSQGNGSEDGGAGRPGDSWEDGFLERIKQEEMKKADGEPTRRRATTVTIHPTTLDAKCPLLASCFRECVRLASQIVTARHVVRDTFVAVNELSASSCSSPSSPSSSSTPNTYLLKAGTNVMMPSKVVHRDRAVWGEDADEFNPRRFLHPDRAQRRARMVSFVPFGGGRHLCPGRHYALAQNLALAAALVLGFDMEGLDGARLRMGDSARGETAKPLRGWEGGQVRIRRREGWEGVRWEFVC